MNPRAFFPPSFWASLLAPLCPEEVNPCHAVTPPFCSSDFASIFSFTFCTRDWSSVPPFFQSVLSPPLLFIFPLSTTSRSVMAPLSTTSSFLVWHRWLLGPGKHFLFPFLRSLARYLLLEPHAASEPESVSQDVIKIFLSTFSPFFSTSPNVSTSLTTLQFALYRTVRQDRRSGMINIVASTPQLLRYDLASNVRGYSLLHLVFGSFPSLWFLQSFIRMSGGLAREIPGFDCRVPAFLCYLDYLPFCLVRDKHSFFRTPRTREPMLR